MLANMLLRVMSAPPVLVDDTAETDASTVTSGNVLSNDTGTLTVSAVNGLAANVGASVAGSNGGVFVIGSDGAWTFDPNGDFSGLSGSETATTSVSYHSSNGSAEASAVMTVKVSAVAAELWTPAQMTTLARWWDADGLPVGSVATWPDKSGNNKHMAQGTVSRQPYSDGKSVTTDGVDDELYVDLTCLIGSTYWVFYVASITSEDMFLLTSLNNVDRGLCQQYIRSSGVYWSHNSSGTDVSVIGLTPSLSIGDPIITCYEYSGNTMRWWRDGILRASLSTTKSLTSLNGGNLGRRAASPTNDDIKIYEIIITNVRPDDALRQKIEGYAAHKWDALLGTTRLVSTLPIDHPHKSAPPTV